MAATALPFLAAPASAQELPLGFGVSLTDPLGFVSPDGAWDVVTSGADLSDIDLMSGALLPNEAFSSLNTAEAMTADMAITNDLAINAQRLAEQARLDAERRRLAQQSGNGQLGPEVPFADLFNTIAPRHGLDPRMVAAVARTESNFADEVVYCRRVSGAGARGLMQLMPATAAGLGVDPCDPGGAIEGGSKMLAQLYAKYSNWELVFAAYNAGPGNVDRYGGIPPFKETKAYVPKVMGYWNEYKARYGDNEGGRMEAGPNGTEVCVKTASKIEVACHLAGQVEAMVSAAAADGITLSGSGWRSHQRQIELRTINHCPDVWTASASRCSPPTAIPGRSMHERAEAIDFERCSTRGTACHQWLARNASRFGFKNLPSEPWHWSSTGG